MTKLLATIADPQSSVAGVRAAIGQLGAVTEPPSFWTDIANSDRYTDEHRRDAVFALVRRHARAPLTLGQLADLLQAPSWLDPSHVEIVRALTGEMPVSFDPADTVVVVPVFRTLAIGRHAYGAIYLRVEGTIDRDAIGPVLLGRDREARVRARRVLEIGLSPNDPGGTS